MWARKDQEKVDIFASHLEITFMHNDVTSDLPLAIEDMQGGDIKLILSTVLRRDIFVKLKIHKVSSYFALTGKIPTSRNT